MCKGLEYTSIILDTYKQINEEYNKIKDRLSYLENAQQDVLHMIENENFSASKGYLLAKQLKELREERRVLKMEFETLNLVVTLVNNQKNGMESIHNKVSEKYRTLKRLQENKIYKNRVLNLE